MVDFNANFGYFDWELRAHMEQLLAARSTLKTTPTRRPMGIHRGGAQGAGMRWS